MDPAGILRPSSAERWAHCPGSHAMEALYPEPESEAAREGTAAHWYVTEAVQGRVHPVGALAPNGVPLDAEMVECGAAFVDYAATLPHPQWVERRLTMHATVHALCEGTPDLVSIDWGEHRIDVVDYKYGHRYVPPATPQLLAYVGGALEADHLDRETTKGWRITRTIIQPRNYQERSPVRSVTGLGWQVWDELGKLADAAHAAAQPGAATVTGDHCRDCSARHACPAAQAVGAHVLDVAGQSIPHELDDHALGLQLALIDRATTRLAALRTGLEAEAMGRIRSGRRVQGWTWEQGEGREAWTLPPDQVVALGETMGVPLGKPATLTPGQARKAGLDPDLVAALSRRPPGAVRLVRSDTPLTFTAFAPPRVADGG